MSSPPALDPVLTASRRSERTRSVPALLLYCVFHLDLTNPLDQIIDYTKVDLPQHLASKFNTSTSQFQVVLDCIGSQALYHKSAFFLASGRKFMTVGA